MVIPLKRSVHIVVHLMNQTEPVISFPINWRKQNGAREHRAGRTRNVSVFANRMHKGWIFCV